MTSSVEWNNLFVFYNTFDTFYGYTYCDFTTYVSGNGCKDCPTNQYSVSPNSTSCMSCTNLQSLSGWDKSRMEMVCSLVSSPVDIMFIISIVTLASGIVFLNVTGLIICRYRRVCCFTGGDQVTVLNWNNMTEEQRGEVERG